MTTDPNAVLFSVVTASGAVMAEATLCGAHIVDREARLNAELVAADADDVSWPLRWGVSTGNDGVCCVECRAHHEAARMEVAGHG